MSDVVSTRRRVAGLPVTEWGSGNGPVVLALPGLGSSASAWRPLAAALPDRHVVSLDLRGRGDAQGMPGPTGLRGHARDVANVLVELDLRDVVVVGHSMGAYLAPLVAQEAPDRIRRLVLVDGGIRPSLPPFMGPRLTRLAFRRQLRSLDREWPDIDAVAAKAKLHKVLASYPQLRPVLLEVLEEEMARTESGALRPRVDVDRCVEDAVDAFWGDDVPAALASVTVPIDLLLAANSKWDGQRPFIRDAAVAPWRDRLPQLTVTRLAGNHYTIVFEGEVVAAVRR